MRPLLRWVVTGFLLLAGFSSGFAGKESVGENLAIPSCRYTSETITLDGKLAEDAWHRAQPLSFHVPVSHARPRTKTIGRLCWDEKYFYVAFEAEDADLRAERTERDSEVYRDDVFGYCFINISQVFMQLLNLYECHPRWALRHCIAASNLHHCLQ